MLAMTNISMIFVQGGFGWRHHRQPNPPKLNHPTKVIANAVKQSVKKFACFADIIEN